VKILKECVEHHDFELLVVLEERPKKVYLIPTPALLSPVPGILERVKNVVNVDVNAISECGQYFKK
jgi:hypothetical protein